MRLKYGIIVCGLSILFLLLIPSSGRSQEHGTPHNTAIDNAIDTATDNARLSVDSDTQNSTDATHVSTSNEKPNGDLSEKSTEVLPLATSASPDPILLEIEQQLKQLVEAKFPDETEVQTLFDIPLEDGDAVAARIGALQDERIAQQTSQQEKMRRLKKLPQTLPPPEKPKILLSPPVMPVAPTAPTPPTPPDMKRPKGKPTPARPEKWQSAYDAWQHYDAQMSEHDEAVTEYKKNVESHREALAAYEVAQNAFEEARISYQHAVDAHRISVEKAKATLQRDLDTISIRMRILTLRTKYLQALDNWMKPLTAPARTALAGLKKQRDTLESAKARATKLNNSLILLHGRLIHLSNRAQAGSISGFQVKLDQMATDLQLVADGVTQRRDKLRTELQALRNLQQLIESQSRDIRHLIFSNVLNPSRDKHVDNAFLKYLTEMRKASKSWFSVDVSLKNIDALHRTVENASVASQDVTAHSEAVALVIDIKSILEKCDAQIDAFGVLREHQKQIFRREAVAILAGLATDHTRHRAYSFSQEILADLTSDAYSLKNAVESWLAMRKEAIFELPTLIKSRSGILLVLRILAAITLLILTGLLGRRLGAVVAYGVRWLSKSRLFRHRPGRLLRYAGLAEALLPTVLVGLTLYASFAILGFSVPEVRFSEVILRWSLIYKLGEKLLVGLTQRVSRGRPAFVAISPAIADMLVGTYRKLGQVSTVAVILLEWSSQWFGSGIMHTLVANTLWGWLCIWGLWALFVWRPVLADALSHRFGETAKNIGNPLQRRIHGLSVWMKLHRTGALLTGPAVAVLVLDWLYRQIRYLLYEGGIVTFFRARLIKRLVNTRKKNSVIPAVHTLPQEYTDAFPMYPIYHEEHAVILPRKKSVAEISEQIDKWRVTRQDSSVVLLGEKGVGKTTLLSLLEDSLPDKVIRYSIGQKVKNEKSLVAELSTAFSLGDCAPVIGAVASHLNQGEEKIVLLDECHNMFLRTINGYDAYEAFIRLVNVTSQNVFWVLVFNSFSFAFLNASKRRLHYFRKMHMLPTWSRDDLFDLISRRNRQSGFEIEFDEVLLDANRSATGDFEVIEGADGFFRLLWENSGGNPRVATCLWLDSLSAVGERKIRVGIFSETLATELSKMDVELLYALAAICQHENLSVSELRDVLNVSADFANFAIRFLTEYGLVEPKHTDLRRHTLAPRFYPQVIKLLRSHHLLYEKE